VSFSSKRQNPIDLVSELHTQITFSLVSTKVLLIGPFTLKIRGESCKILNSTECY